MNDFLIISSGVGLLLLAAHDVYATILHARARAGLLSETINRTLWRATRAVAFRLSRQRRHRLLNALGPLLLPLLIVGLIVCLLIGFALIYLPHMPAEFSVDEKAVSPAWIEALYFSGITLTTVGYGDIAPLTLRMRLIALTESASGFVLISLGVTYLVTVYGALERKRAVALSFYHRADEGADAAALITHHFVEDRFIGLSETLRTETRDIQTLLEAHVEHPIIHYFHPIEVHKGMPRLLFIALESCAIIKSCLDCDKYKDVCLHPEVRSLDTSTRYVLNTLVASLDLSDNLPGKGDRERGINETSAEERQRWRNRWRQTIKQLREEGVAVKPDARASWHEYQKERRQWEAPLHRFATYLGYDWDEVTGDRNLEYAANEKMEEPDEHEGLRMIDEARTTTPDS